MEKMTRILFNFLLVVNFAQCFEECPSEFVGQENACQCKEKGEKQEIWCPNDGNPQVQFEIQPQAAYVVCHDIIETELRLHLRNVNIGASVETLVFKSCPMTSTTFNDYLQDMNATAVEDFRIEYGTSVSGTLVPNAFGGMGSNLKKLFIQNCDISQGVDPLAFNGLENLKLLYLIQNFIPDLPKGALKSMTSLVYLNFHDTKLKILPGEVFDALVELKDLDLKFADETSLKARHFQNNAKVTRLKVGNLDGDILAKDEQSIFHHMTELKNVSINGRSFSNLSQKLFSTNKKLEAFVWHFDKCPRSNSKCISKPPSFLKDLTSLKTFEITFSLTRGVELNEDFFWGCKNLQSVVIKRARMKSVPEQLFRDTKNLKYINLTKNMLNDVPLKLLHPIKNLIKFDLSENKLSSIENDHFAKANKLTELKLYKNNIQSISQKSFNSLSDLKYLDLSNNQIYFNDTSNPSWRYMTSLKEMYLQNNKISISHIPEEFRTTYTQLKVLNLQNNQIGPELQVFPDFNFQASTNLKIDLSNNLIQYLSYETALSHLKPSHGLTNHDIEIVIEKNPLKCDCLNAELARHLQDVLNSPVTSWFKYTYSRSQDCNLKNITLSRLTCQVPSEAYPGICPVNCTCSYAPYESKKVKKGQLVANCSGDETIPDTIPSLTGVNEVDLVTLDLSYSQLTSLQKMNQIKGYENVTGLIISHNDLQDLSNLPLNLQTLVFDHNKISYFDYSQLRKLTALKTVKMGYNPFDCDCESKPLFRYVSKYSQILKDAENIFLNCEDKNLNIINISETKEFCTETKDVIIAIALPISLVILLFLSLIVVFLVYRDYIYIWIYSKPYLRDIFFSAEDNLDKKFDVFVSYSHNDREFVEDEMVPKLEEDPNEFKYRSSY